MIKNNKASLRKGIEIIKNELLTIPNKSGIYQMIGENSEYLYIGKAKNLNNRIKKREFYQPLAPILLKENFEKF